MDRLTDWLNDWLADRQIDRQTTDRQTDRQQFGSKEKCFCVFSVFVTVCDHFQLVYSSVDVCNMLHPCCWLPLLFSNFIWLAFSCLSSPPFFSLSVLCFFPRLPSWADSQKTWLQSWLYFKPSWFIRVQKLIRLTSVQFIMDSYRIQLAMHAKYDSAVHCAFWMLHSLHNRIFSLSIFFFF